MNETETRPDTAPAPTPAPAEEIARLTDLRDKGAITEDEFQSLKAKALA